MNLLKLVRMHRNVKNAWLFIRFFECLLECNTFLCLLTLRLYFELFVFLVARRFALLVRRKFFPKILGISSPCEIKKIILREMRFNPSKARLMLTSHLSDSSFLDIFIIEKKRTDSNQPQNVRNILLSRSPRK